MLLWLMLLLGFVSEKSKSEIEPSTNRRGDDKQESEEPDYEDQDQLEEEHKEEAGEITTTTNRIF